MRWSFIWGGVLIALGTLFLLDNLGLLPVRAWEVFWPLMLIALGGWTLIGVLRRNAPAQATTAGIGLDGAAEARVRIRHGAGTLRVTGGAAPGMLATGSFTGGVVQDRRREGERLELSLASRIDGFLFPRRWGPGGAYDWTLALSEVVPLDLTVETGAGRSQLDLSAVRLSRLRLTTGASETSLILPARPVGTCPIRIEGGVASISVRLPESVEAFLSQASGLTDTHIDRRPFLRVPGGYQTAGYAGASDRLEIKVSMGLGAFTLS